MDPTLSQGVSVLAWRAAPQEPRLAGRPQDRLHPLLGEGADGETRERGGRVDRDLGTRRHERPVAVEGELGHPAQGLLRGEEAPHQLDPQHEVGGPGGVLDDVAALGQPGAPRAQGRGSYKQ